MFTPHSALPGLMLFSAPAGLHQHDLHSDDCLALIMLTSGRKSYALERGRHSVHAGQIAVANPGEVHGCEYVSQMPWSHRTWYLSAALLASLSAEAGLARTAEVRGPVIDSPQEHAQLLQAHAAAQTGGALDRECAAVAALTALLQRHAGNGDERSAGLRSSSAARQRVARCQELMQQSPKLELDLAQLAHAAGVGRHQVIRDFRQVLHLTPGDYLRGVRLARAKEFIDRGHALADAASLVGYSDQSHFSRSFKRVHGFTPGEYAFARKRQWWLPPV
jgi:AraC-like DNA-binding protein